MFGVFRDLIYILIIAMNAGFHDISSIQTENNFG